MPFELVIIFKLLSKFEKINEVADTVPVVISEVVPIPVPVPTGSPLIVKFPEMSTDPTIVIPLLFELLIIFELPSRFEKTNEFTTIFPVVISVPVPVPTGSPLIVKIPEMSTGPTIVMPLLFELLIILVSLVPVNVKEVAVVFPKVVAPEEFNVFKTVSDAIEDILI
jgi:hypothetical protein